MIPHWGPLCQNMSSRIPTPLLSLPHTFYLGSFSKCLCWDFWISVFWSQMRICEVLLLPNMPWVTGLFLCKPHCCYQCCRPAIQLPDGSFHRLSPPFPPHITQMFFWGVFPLGNQHGFTAFYQSINMLLTKKGENLLKKSQGSGCCKNRTKKMVAVWVGLRKF